MAEEPPNKGSFWRINPKAANGIQPGSLLSNPFENQHYETDIDTLLSRFVCARHRLSARALHIARIRRSPTRPDGATSSAEDRVFLKT